MADDTNTTTNNWLKLTPNLEHFDPFAGLTEGLSTEEDFSNIRYGFRIAGQNILVDKNIICEVIPNAYIYPIPNLPAWLTGMINLRGNLIPVINFKRLLFPGTEYSSARNALLVLDRGDKAVATFIDELPVSLEIEESVAEIVSPDDNAADLIREFTTEAYLIDDTIWHEIDHNGLFQRVTRTFSEYGTDSKNEAGELT